jgi:hypothetical protein
MLSVYEPPSDPAEIERWLLTREEEIAEVVVARLTAIIDDASTAFTNTLTAAGDMSVFDSVPIEWSRFVTQDLGDRLGGMYLSGGVSAWVQAPGTDALPESTAQAWTNVVNENAVSYASQATNRLTGPVADSIWNDLRLKVSKAIETGMSTERLTQEIALNRDFAIYRAQMIARTEVNGAYNAGNYQSNQALGDMGPVEKYWVATGDDRTRQSHREADGQVRAFDQPFIVGGSEMMYPHDPSGPASEVVNCRCVTAYLYPGMTRPDGTIVPASPEALAAEEAGAPSPEQARTFRAIVGEGTPTGQPWIEDVPEFTSTREAEAWLERRWSVTYKGETRRINYGNINLEAAQVFTQDTDYLFRTFPDVADNIIKIGSSRDFGFDIGSSIGVASRSERFIYWNETRFTSETWTETFTRAKQKNWFASGQKSQVLHHEFGHHIAYEIEARGYGNRALRMPNEKHLKNGLSPILKRVLGLKGSPGMSGVATKQAVGPALSDYGTTNWQEFIAEAFSESMAGEINGIEVRPLAQAVRDWIDEELARVVP